MKSYLFAIIFIGFLYSCHNSNVYAYENNIGIEPGHLAHVDAVNYTVIEFPDSIRNFGTVKRDEPAVLRYKFRNAGNTALFISNVLAVAAVRRSIILKRQFCQTKKDSSLLRLIQKTIQALSIRPLPSLLIPTMG